MSTAVVTPNPGAGDAVTPRDFAAPSIGRLVLVELRKMVWPTRQETMRTTVVVFVFVMFVVAVIVIVVVIVTFRSRPESVPESIVDRSTCRPHGSPCRPRSPTAAATGSRARRPSS